MPNSLLFIHFAKSATTRIKPIKKIATVATLALILSACGGGGSSSNGSGAMATPTPTPTPPISTQFFVAGDTQNPVSAGQAIGLMAVANARNTAKELQYEWVVTEGDASAVTFSAQRQPATSLSIDKPGTYTITLLIKTRARQGLDTALEKLEQTIEVTAAKPKLANLNVDRAAASGGLASVYFETSTPLSADDWQIVQTSGTAAVINKSKDDPLAQIALPKVTQDELLTFEATSVLDPAVSDTVYILVRPIGVTGDYLCDTPTDTAYCLPVQPLNHHYAYEPSTFHADDIVDCVLSYNFNNNEFCTIRELPYIGLEFYGNPSDDKVPSIDDIMERVVVTHDWMGDNFKQFLQQHDTNNDFKRLLRSTTSIVISEDINPSFYWGATGTMYLSADYLWMTPQQRNTITDTVDYRSGFTQDFDYFFDYDYEKNGQSVLFNTNYRLDRNSKESRSLETLSLPLASLLYHELAHANDYVSYDYIKNELSPNYLNYSELYPFKVIPQEVYSDVLGQQYPLTSTQLKGLAEVWYLGYTATSAEKQYTGQQVATWYFNDRANDDYSYSTFSEDFAMLFEEAMMLSRYGVNRYSVVMDSTGSKASVIQGQKNRIAETDIKDRALFVINSILPRVYDDVGMTLDNTSPQALCVGTTYYEYFNTDCSTITPSRLKAAKYRQVMSQNGATKIDRASGVHKRQTPILPDPRSMVMVAN